MPRRTTSTRTRSAAAVFALHAVVLAAGTIAGRPAHAATLLPGTEISPTGTTVDLEPQRRTLVLVDTVRPFSVPDGRGGVVRGVVKDGVARSRETGTLVFSTRVVLDAGSSTVARPAEWTRSGLAIAAMNADFRTDSAGSVATSSMQRSPDGDRWRTKLARALAPGESNQLQEAWTNALNYDAGGTISIVVPILAAPIVLPAYRPAGTPQPYYTVTQLASTTGLAFLNAYGQVSLSLGDVASGRRPAIWQPAALNATEGSLHLLALPGGVVYAEAGRINARGQVAGTAYSTPEGPYFGDPRRRAFVFTPTLDNQPVGSSALLPLLAGGTRSLARGINDSGQVAGSADYTGAPGDHAVLWSGGGAFRLGLPVTQGVALSINNQGVIGGWGDFGRGTGQGYVWTPTRPGGIAGTVRTVESATSPPATDISEAENVNAAGVAVGMLRRPTPDGLSDELHGWVWPASGFVELGAEDVPNSINGDNVMVGSTQRGAAALFRGRIATKLLYFAAPAVEWRLQDMLDINDAGQIVGLGAESILTRKLLLLTPVRVTAVGACPATRTPFTLALGGTGFAPDAMVRLNGQPLPTTRIDSRTVTAAVPAGLGLGRPNVVVVNGDGSQSIPVTVC